MARKNEKLQNLYKRKDSKNYHYAFRHKGKLLRGTTETDDIIKASEVLREIKKQAESGILEDENTFDKAAYFFMEEKKKTLRIKTLRYYKTFIDKLQKYFINRKLSRLTNETFIEYISFRRKQKPNDNIIKKELNVLSSILDYAVYANMTDRNALKDFSFKKTLGNYKSRERYLTPEECKRLIDCCNAHLKRLVLFALETGMRISEITNLKHEDIIKENGYEFAVIKASIAKNHKERSIPLSKIAVEQINQQKIEFSNSAFIFTDSRGNYYKTTPRKAFNSAKNKAGLNEKYLSFHTLRHTFGSLKWQGLNINGEELKIKPSIKSISKVMGHSNTAITEQVYAKLERKDVLDILGEK